MLSYIVWNINPEIIPIGPLSLRWYGLLFAAAFICSYWVATRFYMSREKFDEKFLDQWLMYIIVGTVGGARLGHVLFYDFSYYINNPIEILMVWKGGLASHGAGIGLIISMFLFSRKYKYSFLRIFDLLVILVSLSGFFVRTGNLMNSEIYGHATKSNYGFVYARETTENLKEHKAITNVSFQKGNNSSIVNEKYVPLTMTLQFEKGIMEESVIRQYMNGIRNTILADNNPDKEIIAANDTLIVLTKPETRSRYYKASIPVLGIPKHPTQIYEALFCLVLFFGLLLLYLKKSSNLREGTIFGIFLVLLFSFRFIIEFIKNVQSAFEADMSLNMGQILSIPFIVMGAGILIWNFFRKDIKN